MDSRSSSEEEETNHLRPWRKRTLQIISTEKWRKTSDVTPLPQVAGHGSWDKSQAILTNKDGCILKPIQAPPRGVRELEFYQEVNSITASPEESQFLPFIPKFFGSCNKRNGQFMMIENLTGGMKKPCIMDIKVGEKTYGPDASEKKKASADSSYMGTKKPFGFSVLGMSVYQGKNKEEFLVKSKDYGKALNKDSINDFVKEYFDKENATPITKLLMENIIMKLENIKELFSQQKRFHIFGSSILFVYDAEALVSDELSEDDVRNANVVKMIDFAHVHPANGEIDENYYFGLVNLINIFKEFAKSI